MLSAICSLIVFCFKKGKKSLITFILLATRFYSRPKMDSNEKEEKVPVLVNRTDVDSWKRKLNDYCTGRKLWNILQGTELRPAALTKAQVREIPASSRYIAVADPEKKIERYESRCEEAFSVMCKAIEKDNIIYGCAQLDATSCALKHREIPGLRMN